MYYFSFMLEQLTGAMTQFWRTTPHSKAYFLCTLPMLQEQAALSGCAKEELPANNDTA